MKPPIFEHHLPQTLPEALRQIKELENAKVLAGGQSLMPMLNLRLAYPEHLIDLNAVAELSYIREEEGHILIGAMTPQRVIEFSDLIKDKLPLISEAILFVGHRQTRNRGTIGGSLCHMDPAAELPLVAMVFNATMQMANADRTRSVRADEFALGLMTTAVQPDEIFTEVRFAPWPKGHGWAFTEYSRRKGDFAIVAAAALVSLNSGGCIERVSLALGGLSPVPLQIKSAETLLLGERASPDLFVRATAGLSEIEPLDDPFAPGWYRQTLAPKLAQQALTVACRRAAETAA